MFFGEAELVSELARVPSTATLFTSMFSHGGLMHLVGNMWFLWLYGDNVEEAMGRFRYLFFYLICRLRWDARPCRVEPGQPSSPGRCFRCD